MQNLVVGRVAKVDVVHLHVTAQGHIGHGAVRAVRVLPGPQAGVVVGLLDLPGIRVDLGVHERDVPLVGLGLLVEKSEDALSARQAHDHGVDLLGDLADLAAELLGHVEERNYHGDGQRQARDGQIRNAEREEHATCQGNHHVDEVAEVHEDGHEDIGEHVRLLGHLEQALVALVEIGLGGRLVAERLHDFLAAHDFLDMTLDHAELALLRNEEAGGV